MITDRGTDLLSFVANIRLDVLCIVEPRLYLEFVLRTVLTPQIHTWEDNRWMDVVFAVCIMMMYAAPRTQATGTHWLLFNWAADQRLQEYLNFDINTVMNTQYSEKSSLKVPMHAFTL